MLFSTPGIWQSSKTVTALAEQCFPGLLDFGTLEFNGYYAISSRGNHCHNSGSAAGIQDIDKEKKSIGTGPFRL